MNLTVEQKYIYDKEYQRLSRQESILKKKYGNNWKQIIQNISLNTARKMAPPMNHSHSDGCSCC